MRRKPYWDGGELEEKVCSILGRYEKRTAISRWRPLLITPDGLSIRLFWNSGHGESFVTPNGGYDDNPPLPSASFFTASADFLPSTMGHTPLDALMLADDVWITLYIYHQEFPFCSWEAAALKKTSFAVDFFSSIWRCLYRDPKPYVISARKHWNNVTALKRTRSSKKCSKLGTHSVTGM
jgi:hypothetical protein